MEGELASLSASRVAAEASGLAARRRRFVLKAQTAVWTKRASARTLRGPPPSLQRATFCGESGGDGHGGGGGGGGRGVGGGGGGGGGGGRRWWGGVSFQRQRDVRRNLVGVPAPFVTNKSLTNTNFPMPHVPAWKKTIWQAWLGSTPMPGYIAVAHETVVNRAGHMDAKLLRDADIPALLPDVASHPLYEHLMPLHRSEFVRAALMFHYGGGGLTPMPSSLRAILARRWKNAMTMAYPYRTKHDGAATAKQHIHAPLVHWCTGIARAQQGHHPSFQQWYWVDVHFSFGRLWPLR